jgi:IMP cyclohydrolase
LVNLTFRKKEENMTTQELAQNNFSTLTENSYPGRGIVIGQGEDANKIFQVYWIMGRSENSRNRVFIEEANGEMRTKAFDESKLTDPSLIIYYPARVVGSDHVITNGDQTDTVADFLKENNSFEAALRTREYEPDGPNFTPRISGIVSLNEGKASYKLSILKSFFNTESQCLRQFFEYETPTVGIGHFISTYVTDGNPLPSFAGEPQLMPLANTAEENLETFWDALNEDNRVSLLVKEIDLTTGESKLLIKNRHQ